MGWVILFWLLCLIKLNTFNLNNWKSWWMHLSSKACPAVTMQFPYMVLKLAIRKEAGVPSIEFHQLISARHNSDSFWPWFSTTKKCSMTISSCELDRGKCVCRSVDEALQSWKIYDNSFLQILEIIGNLVDFFISSHIKLVSFSS